MWVPRSGCFCRVGCSAAQTVEHKIRDLAVSSHAWKTSSRFGKLQCVNGGGFFFDWARGYPKRWAAAPSAFVYYLAIVFLKFARSAAASAGFVLSLLGISEKSASSSPI